MCGDAVCGVIEWVCCRDVSCLEYCFFFFQAEDGIRDLVRSRGLGDVYKRQAQELGEKGIRVNAVAPGPIWTPLQPATKKGDSMPVSYTHLTLPTSDLV